MAIGVNPAIPGRRTIRLDQPDMTGAFGQTFFKPMDNRVPIPDGHIDHVVDVAFPRVVEEAAKASGVWKIWVIESLAPVSGEYICVLRWV